MTYTEPSFKTTSIVSLIAITAGTVSAAWVIMFVSLLVMLLSVGAPNAAPLQAAVVDAHIQSVSAPADLHAPRQKTRYLADAVLRESMHHISKSKNDQEAQAVAAAKWKVISIKARSNQAAPKTILI